MPSIGWPFHVYGLELRKLLAYRLEFWVNFIGQIFFSVTVSYFLWSSIFEAKQVTSMNGFTLSRLILYYLLVPIIFNIQQGENIGAISREIYDGSLNKYLIYPVNFYVYKIMTFMSHATFYFLQLLLIIGLYQFFFSDPTIYKFNITQFTFFIVAIFLSSLCYFAMNSIAEFLAFWVDNIWSLGVIVRSFTRFLGGVLIPLSFFPEWAINILQFTPFPYIVNFPMKIFFGEINTIHIFQNFIILIIWTLFFFSLSRLLWLKGNKQYTGVGI